MLNGESYVKFGGNLAILCDSNFEAQALDRLNLNDYDCSIIADFLSYCCRHSLLEGLVFKNPVVIYRKNTELGKYDDLDDDVRRSMFDNAKRASFLWGNYENRTFIDLCWMATRLLNDDDASSFIAQLIHNIPQVESFGEKLRDADGKFVSIMY